MQNLDELVFSYTAPALPPLGEVPILDDDVEYLSEDDADILELLNRASARTAYTIYTIEEI